MRDRRHDRAKPIESVASTQPGTLGHQALAYLRHLRVRHYSQHTIRGATVHLRLFLEWLEHRGLRRPEQITVSVLERYQRHLYHHRKANDRRLSAQSQYDRLGTVRRFFRWLVKSRVLEMSPAESLEMPRVGRRLPRAVLTSTEAEAVLAQPRIDTPLGLRDRAILEVLYSTGLRRQELVDLDVWDIDREGGTVVVRQGKGKKDRMIPIGERALAWLEKYLEDVRPALATEPDDGALFLTQNRRPLTPVQMSKRVRTHVESAGLTKSGSCHLFRHTMATLMLEGGADLRFIQAMLGHADLSTTQIYTRVAIRQLKEVHELTHPGARLERRAGSDDSGNRNDPDDGDDGGRTRLAEPEANEDAAAS